MERNTYCNCNANAYTGTGRNTKAYANSYTGAWRNTKTYANSYTGAWRNTKANKAYANAETTRIRGYVRSRGNVGNCIYSAKKEGRREMREGREDR